MSTPSNNDANTTIQRPELWTLALGLYPKALHYALFCPAEPQSLIYGELPLEPDNYLASLENAVYDCPVLLNDFRRVTIAVQSTRYMFVPQSLDAADHKKMFDELYPDDEGELATCPLERCGYTALFSVEKGVLSFLQRTFNTPPVALHLAPLAEYLSTHNTEPTAQRAYVNFHHECIDVLAFSEGKLRLCNTYPIRTDKDAVYYVINVFDAQRLDAEHTELQLAGDSPMREPAAEELRRFVNYVMPLSLPAQAMKFSHDIAAVPLHLTMLALCE